MIARLWGVTTLRKVAGINSGGLFALPGRVCTSSKCHSAIYSSIEQKQKRNQVVRLLQFSQLKIVQEGVSDD
jgi:hypothetical protein